MVGKISAVVLSAAGGLTCSPAPSIANEEQLRAYGEHLASECTSCHRIDGKETGIPSIVGWDEEQFVSALTAYKRGARQNQAMISVAKSLEDDQMNALAVYFGSLEPKN
ncbi:MAG: hypothetical protein NW217_15475 [Hyphomicrobiaceae bacterium]|nr:hypothetical protein [Hyphomicrobiaceae bacterium]